MLKQCTHANALPNDPFCPDCGSPLGSSSVATTTCQCGAALQPGDKFCNVCGATQNVPASPRAQSSAIPLTIPTINTTARCVQCGAPTPANALLCSTCQQRASMPPVPPAPTVVPASAAARGPRWAGVGIVAFVLLLLVGGGYIANLRESNQRLQAQAAMQYEEPTQQAQETAAPTPQTNEQTIRQPAVNMPQSMPPPQSYQQPVYQQPMYTPPTPNYNLAPPSDQFAREAEMRRQQEALRKHQEAMQKQINDNQPIIWECLFCGTLTTRRRIDGTPEHEWAMRWAVRAGI